MKQLAFVLSLVLVTAGRAGAQHAMPPGMSHEEHMKQMAKDEALKQQGAKAMGFDQDATEHHFRLAADGGAIVVTARNAADSATVTQVRAHLREITDAFAKGDFAKPFATHGEVPPGVPVMTDRRASIRYRYEERAGGGAVVIATSDAATLGAIHEFLRYQIAEHKTGDPLVPQH